MRVLFLAAAASLAVTACAENDPAGNTAEIDDSITTEEAMTDDTLTMEPVEEADIGAEMTDDAAAEGAEAAEEGAEGAEEAAEEATGNEM